MVAKGEDLSPPGRQPRGGERPEACQQPPTGTQALHEPRRDAMATDNTVTLIGNLTDDPELRFTANGGAAVANFRLAVTPGSARATSGPTERPASFASTAGGSSQSTSPRPLGKGNRAIAIGRLRLRSWEADEGETAQRGRGGGR